MLKIICISDTHCRLRKVKIPDGDLLIHSGDLTFRGDIQEIAQEARQLAKMKNKFTHGILFVPGNHDWLFQRNEQLARQIMGDIKVLIDQEITIEELKFYGSPWQPEFCNWAYNLPRGEPLKKKWTAMPDDTDVLITHSPPYGTLDQALPYRLEHLGCEELRDRVMNLPNLKLHNFGHIHESRGKIKSGNTLFINSSICDGQYKPINLPIEILI